MSSSVSVTALDHPRGFPSVCVFHTVTLKFSKSLSASYFDSLASSSSREFSASCTIRLGSTQLSVAFDESWSSNLLDPLTTPWSCVLPRFRSRLGLVLVALWCTPSRTPPSRPLALDHRGLVLSARIASPCFHTAQIPAGTVVACSTGFHQTSLIVVTRFIWSWLAFITMY